jgi:hypothetical protein
VPLPARPAAAGRDPSAHQPDPRLAALFRISQSTVDRIIDHLVPVLADLLRSAPHDSAHPWIIDGTLIPVHDQSITAISSNYRHSVNFQIIICAHRRRVIRWPVLAR